MSEITRDLTAKSINEIEDIVSLHTGKVKTYKLLDDINAGFGEYMATLSVLSPKERKQYKNCPFPWVQFRTIAQLEYNVKRNISTLMCAIRYKDCQACLENRNDITCNEKYKCNE